MTLTAIPSNFGAGGVGLQGLNNGKPALRTLLEEHRAAIEALQQADGFMIARLATTADHALTGLTAIDGVVPVAGNRILVRAQTSADENGLYVAAAGAWTRSVDDSGDDVIASGMIVQVLEGTVNGDRQFFLATDNPITVDTTALTFTKIPNLADLASTANGFGGSLIGLEDAADRLAASDVEGGVAEVAADTDTISPGLPMQNRLRLLGAPGAAVEGNTVTIGADVYEFRGDSPPTGGTAGRIWVYNGANSADSRQNLIDAINGAVDAARITYDGAVTETMKAIAGVTTGDILVQSADAVGGTVVPSATATAVADGLDTVLDVWDSATMRFGKVQAASQVAAVSVTLGANDVAKGTLQVAFGFTPTACVVSNRMRQQDEAYLILGDTVYLTLAGGASPNNQAADVIDIVAFA